MKTEEKNSTSTSGAMSKRKKPWTPFQIWLNVASIEMFSLFFYAISVGCHINNYVLLAV